MDLHQRIRKLIYVPQLSDGRKTFLHFYWDGKAWSLREFADPHIDPRPRYQADVHLTVEEILMLARAPGAFCIDAPVHPVKDIPFWYEQTVAANRRFLDSAPDPTEAQISASTRAHRSAPVIAPRAPRETVSSPASYRSQLLARFWRYREERFVGAAHLFDGQYRPGAQPPVFKPEHAHRNVLVRPDAEPDELNAIWSAIPDGRRHKWFRSMTSSQALTQSVFANLKYHNKLGLLADLRGEDRLPPFPSGVVRPRYAWGGVPLELEYQVNYLGEPRSTGVDVMFNATYTVAVECKLSEPEVGGCSRPNLRRTDSNFERDHCDGTYTHQRNRRDRCALTERGIAYWQYIPKLFTWPAGTDMRPCPLHTTYQLVRNILAACVLPNGDLDPAGHAVLLYDARNPEFAEGGKGHRAWQTVHSALKNQALLQLCTWQDLVACLRQDDDLNWLTEALRSKYGF